MVSVFIPSILDLPALILAILIGHAIINAVCKRHGNKVDRNLLTKLFYYHLAFSFIYIIYIMFFGGDARGYWLPPIRFIGPADSILRLHSPGSAFIHFLTFPLSQILGLSLWGGAALFSLFGFSGVVCIYLTMRKVLRVNPTLFGIKLFPLVLFLPNMHFWSSGVGKDSIIFFSLALFVYCLTDLKKNIPFLLMSFYLGYYVRPHIALVMVAGAAIALVLSSRGISPAARIGFFGLALTTMVLISSSVFTFIGVEEDIESYEDVTSIRSKNLSRGNVGSRIAISNMPVPLKILTFLYRPLIFDANNLFGLVVSFENLFYLTLTISVLRWRNIARVFRLPLPLMACGVMALATAYFMSGSLSNLGIIIRQKNMVMFMVVLISMYFLAEYQARARAGITRVRKAARPATASKPENPVR